MLEGHESAVYAVCDLGNGKVASGSRDNTVRVWTLATGECDWVFEGHEDGVSALAALSGGRLVSGSRDKLLIVWRIEDGEAQHVLEGHTDFVRGLAAVDDDRFVSCSDDKTLRVWDTRSGACERVLQGHQGFVFTVAALPGGRVASGSSDGTLRLWDVRTGRCLDTLACEGNEKDGVKAAVCSITLLGAGGGAPHCHCMEGPSPAARPRTLISERASARLSIAPLLPPPLPFAGEQARSSSPLVARTAPSGRGPWRRGPSCRPSRHTRRPSGRSPPSATCEREAILVSQLLYSVGWTARQPLNHKRREWL